MNTSVKKLLLLSLLLGVINIALGQNVIQDYLPIKNDSIRIGVTENDFLPLIQSGYTLMLPENKTIKGVLIFLEDSGYDKKNKSAKQVYNQASEHGFAVLSVSTEIPFDFYFTKASLQQTHKTIQDVFLKHHLPNKNIFFLGASLTGHRAMQYIKLLSENKYTFQPKIEGIVICDFTLDWTRKWHQHKREIRIKQNDIWEATFINYMLETYLNGTPETTPEQYHNFSPYSYFDKDNRNIKIYKNYAIRAYIDPAIKYRLTKQLKTLYENNATDIVGFLAELKLAGNDNTELIVLSHKDNNAQKKSTQSTWDATDKNELMDWIIKQLEK